MLDVEAYSSGTSAKENSFELQSTISSARRLKSFITWEQIFYLKPREYLATNVRDVSHHCDNWKKRKNNKFSKGSLTIS